MIEDMFDPTMATKASILLATEMRKVLAEKRLSYTDERTGKPISLRSLAAKASLDVAILHRAENPAKETLPNLPFYLDWSKSLDLFLGDVIKEAQERLDQQSGE